MLHFPVKLHLKCLLHVVYCIVNFNNLFNLLSEPTINENEVEQIFSFTLNINKTELKNFKKIKIWFFITLYFFWGLELSCTHFFLRNKLVSKCTGILFETESKPSNEHHKVNQARITLINIL